MGHMPLNSGHAECEDPECASCRDIAIEIEERLNISKSFQEGSLIVSKAKNEKRERPTPYPDDPVQPKAKKQKIERKFEEFEEVVFNSSFHSSHGESPVRKRFSLKGKSPKKSCSFC